MLPRWESVSLVPFVSGSGLRGAHASYVGLVLGVLVPVFVPRGPRRSVGGPSRRPPLLPVLPVALPRRVRDTVAARYRTPPRPLVGPARSARGECPVRAVPSFTAKGRPSFLTLHVTLHATLHPGQTPQALQFLFAVVNTIG